MSIERLTGEWAWRSDNRAEIDRRLDIEGALSKLPPQYARIILLRFMWGYSPAEVAEILGVALDTVNGAVTTSRRRMGAELSDWWSGPRVKGQPCY